MGKARHSAASVNTVVDIGIDLTGTSHEGASALHMEGDGEDICFESQGYRGNHLQHHLEDSNEAAVPPAVDQVEMHPYVVLDDLVGSARKTGSSVKPESARQQQGSLLREQVLLEIGEARKIAAQVVLR